MSENWDETPDAAAANRFQDQDEARAAGGAMSKNEETRAAGGAMSKNEETRAALSAAVARLGEGYKGGRAWVRCPNRDPTLQPAAPVSAATAAAAAAKDENAAMPMNQEETRDALSAAVVKLGKGYQGGRAWPRRPTWEPVSAAAAAATTVSAGDDMEDDNSVVAAALRAGYNYRSPGPFRAEDDFAGGRSMGGSPPCMSWRRAWRRLTVPRTRAATTARTARTRSTPPTPAPAWIQRQSWQQTRWSLCAPKKKVCFVYTVFLFLIKDFSSLTIDSNSHNVINGMWYSWNVVTTGTSIC